MEFKNLADFLETRIRQTGHSTISFSEALGLSSGYINGVIRGHFNPSAKACRKIAEYTGDDEQMILKLAGHFTPAVKEGIVDQIARQVATLSPEGQAFIAHVVEYQKWVEAEETITE